MACDWLRLRSRGVRSSWTTTRAARRSSWHTPAATPARSSTRFTVRSPAGDSAFCSVPDAACARRPKRAGEILREGQAQGPRGGGAQQAVSARRTQNKKQRRWGHDTMRRDVHTRAASFVASPAARDARRSHLRAVGEEQPRLGLAGVPGAGDCVGAGSGAEQNCGRRRPSPAHRRAERVQRRERDGAEACGAARRQRIRRERMSWSATRPRRRC